jgi:hypothetical protein
MLFSITMLVLKSFKNLGVSQHEVVIEQFMSVRIA